MLRKVTHPASVLAGQVILCLVSAGMLFAAFPYLDQSWLAWAAFVPWFFALRNASRRRAFLLSCLTGIIFWGATAYWIIHVTMLGMVGLVLYLSLYSGIFGLTVSLTIGRSHFAQILLFPSVWVLLEFLRSHLLTGFPWALVAYTQAARLPVIQAADITGAWGISFLIVAVNTAIYGAAARLIGRKRPSPAAVASAAVLLAAVLAYGRFSLVAQSAAGGERLTVSVIQGNVPHEQKWQADTRDSIMATHLGLTRDAAAAGADLIVWSEAALPVILENEPQYFEQARSTVAAGKAPLLMGSITNRGRAFFNSALLLMPTGGVSGVYDKIHLVPFGEYVPLRDVFTFLETLAPIGQLDRGKTYTVFAIPGREGRMTRFSALVCFEDAFPEMARNFVLGGAEFLVNITNDAWYRYSPATYQHRQAAVFRAVENRVPLVRCANTGVSCFIDRTGKVTGVLRDPGGKELFFAGHAEGTVEAAAFPPTFYTRYGDYFIWVCLLLALLGALFSFAVKA